MKLAVGLLAVILCGLGACQRQPEPAAGCPPGSLGAAFLEEAMSFLETHPPSMAEEDFLDGLARWNHFADLMFHQTRAWDWLVTTDDEESSLRLRDGVQLQDLPPEVTAALEDFVSWGKALPPPRPWGMALPDGERYQPDQDRLMPQGLGGISMPPGIADPEGEVALLALLGVDHPFWAIYYRFLHAALEDGSLEGLFQMDGFLDFLDERGAAFPASFRESIYTRVHDRHWMVLGQTRRAIQVQWESCSWQALLAALPEKKAADMQQAFSPAALRTPQERQAAEFLLIDLEAPGGLAAVELTKERHGLFVSFQLRWEQTAARLR